MKTWLRIVAMAACGLAIVPSYLRAYKVSTPSETPSINIGDSFLVNQAAYHLRVPYTNATLVRTGSHFGPKRVIGLPGETIEFRENRVLIDGHMLSLAPLNRADFNWVAPANNIGSGVYNEDGHWISFTPGKGQCRNHKPVTLDGHQYFVVGDNRDVSLDSRIWGPVGEERILGRVMITYARSK
jgi:signal peptidase I